MYETQIEIFFSCIRIEIIVLYLNSCRHQLGIKLSQISILLVLLHVAKYNCIFEDQIPNFMLATI